MQRKDGCLQNVTRTLEILYMNPYVADYFHSDFKILKAVQTVQDLWRSSELPHAKLKDMQITSSPFLLNQEI